MGTGNGVIISVPLCSQSATMNTSTSAEKITDAIESGSRKSSGVTSPIARGDVVKVYADSHNDRLTMETFIPYCSMAQAQLSFHGHRDAVKFFVSVTGPYKVSFSYRILYPNRIIYTSKMFQSLPLIDNMKSF